MLTDDELQQLLQLSRLSVSDEVARRLGEDVRNILAFADQLAALDTDAVAPMVHATELTQPRRADRATEVLGARCLDEAARTQDGMVEVPKVVDP